MSRSGISSRAPRARQPSPAASEAVLLALASPREPLLGFHTDGARRFLTVAGVLRLSSLRDGRIACRALDAKGGWRATEIGHACLIEPSGVIEAALEHVVDRALACAGEATATPADRSYVARRLREDLYPRADGAHALRAVRRTLFETLLDRGVLRATFLIFGRHARVEDYNDIVRAGPATFLRLTRETPNLAPLMVGAVRTAARRGSRRPGHDLIGRLRRELLAPPGVEGLAPRDWKWLSHQARSAVAALMRVDDGDDAPRLDSPAVRLFCGAGLPRAPASLIGLAAPGGALHRALLALRDPAPVSRFPDLARLLRLAGQEWLAREARGHGTRFLRDDLGYLIDWWLAESGAGAIVPRNATLPSLIRRQQRWHQLVILRHPEFLQQWRSAVPAHERGGVRFVPLTDSLMLAREGMEMRHCVASFSRDCAAGHTRIFALELIDSGERATLELRRRASTWFTGQLKGPCNGEVSDILRAAAERLAQRYTATAKHS